MRNPKIRPVRLIQNEREAAAYLHPVRMRILQFLCEARTISQTAEMLSVHPANLTHHFRKLQSAALIRLVEERDTGRVVEKYYQAVARTFEVRSDSARIQGAGQRALYLLQKDMATARLSLPADAENLLCMLGNGPVSARLFTKYEKKLRRLMEEFRAEAVAGVSTVAEEGPETHYSLSLALYPRGPDLSARRRR